MQRFVLEQNLKRFRERRANATDEAALRVLDGLILAAERDLALLDSNLNGVRKPWERLGPDQLDEVRAEMIARFRERFTDAPVLAALIDPGPGLAIVEINPTYERSSGVPREQLLGQPLFKRFPDNPEDAAANGVGNLYASLQAAADTGRVQPMAPRRYDTHDPVRGWTARYWRTVNTPMHDEAGRLVFLLHVVEEATGGAAPADLD